MKYRVLAAGIALLACSKDQPAAPIAIADAGVDAPTPIAIGDAAIEDGGTEADARSACAVPDVSNLPTPAWVPVTPLGQSACTQEQITRYQFECLSTSGTTEMCAPFHGAATTADGRCGACIDTGSTTLRGPVFVVLGVARLDVAGCIANAQGNGAAGNSCASAFATLDDCHAAVCTDACATNTPACSTDANGGACKSYAAKTSCVVDAGADVAACLTGKNFPETFTALVTAWCGAQGDAG